jgi:CRISPR-associated protein Cas1
MLSKRACVFYLEHAKVVQKDHRVVYLAGDATGNTELFFNIPEKNTALLLLGKGSSISDSAMRVLAQSNVVVGFCGSGGSPLLASVDYCFLSPQSEYRPTEYAQAWVQAWFDESQRLKTAKYFLNFRVDFCQKSWGQNVDILKKGLAIPEALIARFRHEIGESKSVTELLLAEARWTKAIYGLLAQAYRLRFRREEGEGKKATPEDVVNSFIDHGNYIAYGFASVVLNGLGIPFAFPVMHGKTRRGALVFDVADLFKDAFVLPFAFESGTSRLSDQDFRLGLIENLQEFGMLDFLFGFVSDTCEKFAKKQ